MPPAGASQFPFAATLCLFVLSGATGLVDQICFAKYLTYIVGSTAYAVSAVLAAFMTGLALGAHLGGKRAARVERPLFAYGVLELVVAVFVALTPFGFELLTPLYAALARSAPDSLALISALRWLVALALVVVPTTAMGATLPLLTRALEEIRGDDGVRERRLGALYAANTLGGAVGSLGAAYMILPLLGVRGTLLASALASAAVGLGALQLGRAFRVQPGGAVVSASVARLGAEPRGSEARLLALLALLSGCLVFAAEVVFTHLLALIIGNSAYAFGLILAIFLLCLFFGAARTGALRARLEGSALPLGLVATGLALIATLSLWDKLPFLFTNTGEVIKTFGAREVTRAVAAFVILCVPTTIMGFTFPLILQRVAAVVNAERWVGRLTAVNTIGAVCGSLLTGYVILPALGSERSLLLIAGCFLAAGLLSIRWARPRDRRLAYGGGALALALAIFVPRWNLPRLTSGTNVYFEGWKEPEALEFLREDVHGGVTTVTRESSGVRTLYTNGKFQGNTGWEMNAQRFFAHYPSLFVSRFDRAMVIGLGTGTTLGTLAAYPWKRLDVVEISPSIVAAARQHFQSANLGAIDDPRTHLHLGDGRNYLLVHEDRYDLLSMELSSIWFAGASSLYSREYYELVRSRLAPGGVFQQWVQLHHVFRKDFSTIVNTLRHVFPHVALFYGGGQGILVASESPLAASASRVHALEKQAQMRRIIPNGKPLLELLDDLIVVDDSLDRYLAESAQLAGVSLDDMVSTDHNLYLEYATPRGNVLPWVEREVLVSNLRRHRDQSAIDTLIVD
ncbi:MAG TPA: fused MFS/spermidine synthase [Polyangiaceae bacterium]|nr:fused MFS/spermidine synthase [Polyangiaceae bacterium]